MSIKLSQRQSGSGHITTITYSREEKLNSLNSEGIQELHQAFLSLSNDEDLRAIVLTCLLYTSPSPRDGLLSRMPSSA